MNCKNCNADMMGAYCHHCGQKVVERFSVGSVAAWVADDLFVFDKGFFYTIRELVLHPVEVINNYLSGITKRYFNPYKLLLIVTTVPFLIISFLPDFQNSPTNTELLQDWPGAFTSESVKYFVTNSAFFITTNFLAYFLITIPFWSMLSRLLFRKRQLNFVEHLIFVSYLTSGIVLLLICSGALFFAMAFLLNIFFTEEVSIVLGSAGVFVIYVSFLLKTAKGFYDESYVKVILKGILAAYLGLGCSFVLQFVILSVWKLVVG